MYAIYISGVILLLVFLSIRTVRSHIGFSNYSNMIFYIKVPINKALCFCTILRIPNVDCNFFLR